MKILLTAINAKYIHSNPAVYSLRAYAGEEAQQEIQIAEYTINHRCEDILAGIYRHNPDVVAISCYIWNWKMVTELLPELSKILPGAEIWLGGPEVSYCAGEVLQKFPGVRGIIVGEGEKTFRELWQYYHSMENGAVDDGQPENPEELCRIRGLVYREEENIVYTGERELTNLTELPFLYSDMEPFENRILYYESSRGCPYRCSYCLSSIDKKVRLRDIEVVKRELTFFLERRVKQVKFVDRTFNCNREHAAAIWKFLQEHDNGVTNFHFEIEADLITQEQLALLGTMRPGLMQMEIGVQTFHPQTLQEINRTTDMDRLCYVVNSIREKHNIHVHLDLIAGLPYEDYETFRDSFNKVYALHPEQLQLGFLKVLKGSPMYEKAEEYGLAYLDSPPYEVLFTKWLSYEELLRLKEVEEMVEIYYNSNQYVHTIALLEKVYPDAFGIYEALAAFYKQEGLFVQTPSRAYRYQVLFAFCMTTTLAGKEEIVKETLLYDLYLRENSKSRPEFAAQDRANEEQKRWCRAFYEEEEKNRIFLKGYEIYDSRQMARMTHIEFFTYPVWEKELTPDSGRCEEPEAVLFDYQKRDPLTGDAAAVRLPSICSA